SQESNTRPFQCTESCHYAGVRVLNSPRLPLIVCPLLLAAFALLAWSSVTTKSPTADETLHAVSAWTQTYARDFRITPEDPPLWKYAAVLPQDSKSLRLDTTDPDWQALLTNIDRQAWFTSRTLYRTPGIDGAAFVNRSRAVMLIVGLLLPLTVMVWSSTLAGPLACV